MRKDNDFCHINHSKENVVILVFN